MLPNNEQNFVQWSEAAENLTTGLPHPTALGGLLMLYGRAIHQEFTFAELVECFGFERLELMDRAAMAAVELWELRHGDDDQA